MENPFITRNEKGGKGKQGRRAESLVVDRLGGKGRIGSGSLPGMKGDLEVLDFLVENKTTLGDSIRLQLDWLMKIYQEAMAENKNPALSFQFVNEGGLSDKRGRWVCIPEHVFQELIESYHGVNNPP